MEPPLPIWDPSTHILNEYRGNLFLRIMYLQFRITYYGYLKLRVLHICIGVNSTLKGAEYSGIAHIDFSY